MKYNIGLYISSMIIPLGFLSFLVWDSIEALRYLMLWYMVAGLFGWYVALKLGFALADKYKQEKEK